MVRIHVHLTVEERDRLRRQAAREGLSLAAWLRQAGLERARGPWRRDRFRGVGELRAFFARCDEQAGAGPEPSWEEHLRTMNRSRRTDA